VDIDLSKLLAPQSVAILALAGGFVLLLPVMQPLGTKLWSVVRGALTKTSVPRGTAPSDFCARVCNILAACPYAPAELRIIYLEEGKNVESVLWAEMIRLGAPEDPES